jgi:hypothetical protein
LNGNYNYLNSNLGGVVESIYLKSIEADKKNQFWCSLFQSHNKNSLIGCAIEGQIFEEKRNDGLLKGHGYAITKLSIIKYRGKEQKLLR